MATDTSVVIRIDEGRVAAFAAKAAQMAFNRLEGPIREVMADAEDTDERDELALALGETLGRAVRDAVILRLGLL